jgi:hypothetical protein
MISAQDPPATFWVNWLTVVAAGVSVFGLMLVLLPDLAAAGFSLLVYADSAQISSFGHQAVAYIALAHAVLGSIMVGWGVALVVILRKIFAQGYKIGWTIVAASAGAWFVPDTIYSIWSGFWPNAVLNAVFLVLFAIPLLATRKSFSGKQD